MSRHRSRPAPAGVLTTALVAALLLPPGARGEVKADVGIQAWAVSAEGEARSNAHATLGLFAGGAPGYLRLQLAGRCAAGFGSVGSSTRPPEPGELAGARRTILATARFVSLEDGEARFDVTYSPDAAAAGASRGEASAVETLLVRLADRKSLSWFPFELVEETEPECPYRRVLVGLTVALVEDPALAASRLAYDAWWEHVAPDGRVTTRRLEREAGQGEAVDLAFPSLRRPVAEDGRFENVLDVAGRLEGRVRDGGSIDVTLDVDRWVGVAPVGRPRSGGIGDGGRKTFALSDGETVRMELPPVSGGLVGATADGHAGFNIDGPAATAPRPPGIPAMDVEVDTQAGWAGHRDALVLTVRRLE